MQKLLPGSICHLFFRFIHFLRVSSSLGGPDVCIDAVGFRYTKGKVFLPVLLLMTMIGAPSSSSLGLMHKLQRAVFMETDTPEILSEAIKVVRKGGTIAVIGD